jgi:hypothetical protein
MSQASSFVGSFDLNSQAGVMSVLASIRASSISAQDKNELRDLVFLYTKGGGDPSVRIDLEQKLTALQIAPVAIKNSAPTGPTLAFGSYRPTPTFKVPNVPVPSSAPTVPAPASAMPIPVPAPAPIVPPSPVSTLPVVEPVVPLAPVQPSAVMPEPVAAPVPTPQVAVVPEGEVNYLERIRQIKTAVNSKVGNPVNLVDIDNAVGREYMNALLEAMKKLSSGAVSEMGPVMTRLEKAFVEVEVAIAKHQPVSPEVPVPQPVAVTSVPVPPVSLTEDLPEIVPEAAIEKNLPPRPIPKAVVAEAIAPEVEIVNSPINDERIPLVDIPNIVPTPLNENEGRSGFESGYDNQPPAAPALSLADQQKVLTINDLPNAASLSTGAAGDILFTKEVDDGLDQLLSDWTIFKKSGLFGTGPKGREHPLFKKIAELPIPLILAGRFDGSTQEIRQSITDYMNGWRYEQGIIYQPGETFDRYLRRVIRHIIDLQKKHGQA